MQYKTRLNRHGRIYLPKELGRHKAEAWETPKGLLLILTPLFTTPLWPGGYASVGSYGVASVFGQYPNLQSIPVVFYRDERRRLGGLVRPEDVTWALRNCGIIRWEDVDWTRSNQQLADSLGVSFSTVYRARQLWAPDSCRQVQSVWRGADWTLPNKELARLYGATAQAVAAARYRYAR